MPRKVTPTHVLLNQITLASSAATVTFSNIPQNYGDLVLTVSIKSGNGGDGVTLVRFNGDSGNNYARVYVYAESGAYGSYSNTGNGAHVTLSNINTSFFDLSQCSIFDYATTDKHKSVLIRGNTRGSDLLHAQAATWTSTSAVTSLQVVHSGTNTFAANSTFSLYGIVA